MSPLSLREIPDDEGNPFCSLRQLLGVRTSPGELATAIEQHGIYSWDRFGRYTKYESGSDEAKRALDLLEFSLSVRRFESDANEDTSESNQLDLLNDFGWAAGALPSFDTPIAEKQLSMKERHTLLVLVAALCKRANIDFEDRNAASAIARMTDAIGASVTDETVKKVLKQLSPALASRKR